MNVCGGDLSAFIPFLIVDCIMLLVVVVKVVVVCEYIVVFVMLLMMIVMVEVVVVRPVHIIFRIDFVFHPSLSLAISQCSFGRLHNKYWFDC